MQKQYFILLNLGLSTVRKNFSRFFAEISLQHAHEHTRTRMVLNYMPCMLSVVDGGVRAAPSRRLPASIPSPP